jgi:hypothetical protein
MQTFQELMTSAMAEAGYSDAEVSAALGKIYSNDKLGPKLNALVKTATEDYQAQVGRVKQYQDWYPKAQAEYDRMATEYTKARAELEALQGGNGTAQPPAFDASKYVSKEDLVAMQVDMGRRYAGVIKDTAAITSRHVTRFKEEPDFAAIDKLATDLNIPLQLAYEKYIEPRVKEEEKAARATWEKSKTEEIERDLRTRYKMPVESTPPEQSPLLRQSKPEDAPKDMDAELLGAWRSVPAKA